ncbi:MAG: IPTL-CTERM sorting domain-containing protein [Thermoanaerobaculia bacterium]
MELGPCATAGEDEDGVALPAGTSVQSFAVPAGAAPGTTLARFRCTTDGAVSPSGEASDGEVEDYAVVVTAPPDLAATKTAEVPGGGALRLGGTLGYTVVLTNSGGEATGVVFTDTVDPDTTVVPGSTTTTQGTVTAETDTTVEVDVGTVGPGESVVITFDIQVSEVPAEDQVSNQGLFTAGEGVELVTDDPDTEAGGDPTVTALLVSPLEIPTLEEAGLLALGLLLAGLAWRRLGG